MLLLEQVRQGGFLLWAALQNEHHAIHGQVGRSGALVELRSSQRMSIAAKNGQAGLIDAVGDAWAGQIRLRGGESRQQQEKRAGQKSFQPLTIALRGISVLFRGVRSSRPTMAHAVPGIGIVCVSLVHGSSVLYEAIMGASGNCPELLFAAGPVFLDARFCHRFSIEFQIVAYYLTLNRVGFNAVSFQKACKRGYLLANP